MQGKNPTIIEMQNDLIVSDKICLANTSYLRDFFETNKVPVYLESRATEIRDDGITIADKSGKTTEIKADSVIISAGYNPNPVAKGSHIHIIGDAYKVGSLRTVIWQAWDKAMKI